MDIYLLSCFTYSKANFYVLSAATYARSSFSFNQYHATLLKYIDILRTSPIQDRIHESRGHRASSLFDFSADAGATSRRSGQVGTQRCRKVRPLRELAGAVRYGGRFRRQTRCIDDCASSRKAATEILRTPGSCGRE